MSRRPVSTPTAHDGTGGVFVDDIGMEEEVYDDTGKKKATWTRFSLAGSIAFGIICLYLFLSDHGTRVIQQVTGASPQLEGQGENFHTPDLSLPVKVAKSDSTTTSLEKAKSVPATVAVIPSAVKTKSGDNTKGLISRELVEDHIAELRQMKRSGVVMETDQKAKDKIRALQDELRAFVVQEWGPEPYRVEMTLTFPETMKDYETAGPTGVIQFELAPLTLVPYSTYFFLEVIRKWKGGAFHRNAGHVLQALVHSDSPGLAFQEYSPEYPHKRLTMGYAGRPGGPAFYISTIDNTDNHGPASQGSNTEADSCFAKIVAGEEIVKRMQKQPGRQPPSGFIDGPKNYIKISELKIVK